jgi:hypothetical protein
VSLCASFDHPIRREFYGRAGEYRLPTHGLEYRVPSAADLCHPIITHLSWDLARIALHMGLENLTSLWETSDEETIEVINNTDVSGARKILERNRGLLKALMLGAYGSDNGRAYRTDAVADIKQLDASEAALTTIMNGIEAIVTDPMDVVGNWKLKEDWAEHCDSDRMTFVAFANTHGLVGR